LIVTVLKQGFNNNQTQTHISNIPSSCKKGLKKLYESGSKRGVKPEHAVRLRLILARLDASTAAEDMNLPGLSLHLLKGSLKNYWSVSVSGNWRVIFRF